MKLSLFLKYLTKETSKGEFSRISDIMDYCLANGVECIDILDYSMGKRSYEACCKIVSDAGMTVNCFIATSPLAVKGQADHIYSLEKIKEKIDESAKYGVNHIMLAPHLPEPRSESDFLEQRDLLIKDIDQICSYAKDSGIRISIENQSSPVSPMASVEDLKYILDCIPPLGYTLDMGNFEFVGVDLVEAYKSLKDRLIYIHCKNVVYDRFGEFIVENKPRIRCGDIRKGVLPLREASSLILADGYDGNVLVEINSPCTLHDIDSSVSYVRELFKIVK